MKQTKKILSLVLALVMALSCMSVIGSAASSPITKGGMTYDRVDDAVLTPDQVAGIVCDLLDNEILPGIGMDPIDENYLVAKIYINLSSINEIYKSLDSIMGLRGLAGGDLGDLTDTGIYKDGNPRSRSNSTDLDCLLNAVYFLGNSTNAGILSQAANGILVDGTSEDLEAGSLINTVLGWINLDLSDINDLLLNLPSLLNDMVYDMLIFGSYNASYENESYPSVEDLTAEGADYATLPADVDNLDKMLQQAVTGLLMSPQEYEWVDPDNDETTDNSVKEWDMSSIVFPTIAGWDKATVNDFFGLYGSSQDWNGNGAKDKNNFFELLDKIAPFAIYDLGIPSLNYNLKKTLMEAVDVEFNEIKEAQVPADVKAIFDAEEYVTYIAYDCLEKSSDGNWYYTTFENVPTGEIDPETKEEITEKQHVYYKANAGGANGFYSMINWDWDFFAYEPYKGYGEGDGTEAVVNGSYEIDYPTMIAKYGSIFGSLNHLLYIVFDNALTTETKNAFKAMTTDGWVDGDNTVLNENLVRLIKYLLAEHADSIFGKDSAYVDWTYDDVKNLDIIDLVAIIGPSFFADVMPQLIIPQNADGTYAFGDTDQLLKFASIVIREFVSEISPTTNYDAYIFEGGSATSANGRFFKSSNKTDDWYNIILNMGLDIGYTYLQQLTNFAEATPAADITEARWMGMLDKVVTWGVEYVGSGNTSVINGLDPTTIASKGDAFGKLSYVLNTLLPLGFINGCTANGNDFDVATLFGKVKSFFTTVDFELIFGLFGRNSASKYNPLRDVTVPEMVLDLVNDILTLVIGNDLLPYENSVAANITNAYSSGDQINGLKKVVYNLLNGLNNRIAAVANNALPIVAKFIGEWGGEQEFGTPTVSVDKFYPVNSSTINGTITFTNGSKGIWRGYKASAGATSHSQDEQYKYALTKVEVYNVNASANGSATTSFSTTSVDFGASTDISFSVPNVTKEGLGQRFRIYYIVYNEDDVQMGDEFYLDVMTQLDNYSDSFGGTLSTLEGANAKLNVRGPYSYDLDAYRVPDETTGELVLDMATLATDIANQSPLEFIFEGQGIQTKTRTIKATVSGGTQYGITLNSDQASKGSGTGEFYTNLTVDQANADFIAIPDTVAEKGFISAKFSVTGNITREKTWTSSAVNVTSPSATDVTVTIYDSKNEWIGKLRELVNEEMDACRTVDDYVADGRLRYASEVLVAVDDESTPDEYEKVTNFTTTAVNPESTSENAQPVTVINTGVACSNYIVALEKAMQAAYQGYDDAMKTNYEELYKNLLVAVNDIKYCQKTAEEYAAEGGGLNAEIEALEAQLESVEETWSTEKDYTDYMMYRWNRYNDVREDAKDIINKYNAAFRTEADLTKFFPYNWMEPSDLEELVADDKYEAYILALLEDYSEEEIEANRKNLDNAKTDFALIESIDVAQASNLLSRIPDRLIERNNGTKDIRYLTAEIESAKNMIGTDNGTEENPTKYTWRSWKRYIEAYNTALEVQAAPTQMNAFDSKYELLCARNELVLLEDAADYSELEALIAQATQAVANASLYNNTDKEIGLVLAQLGYSVDGTDLFPGSALYYNEEPYSKADQDVIDDAADRLKEALSKLKFNGLNFTGAPVSTETIVEGNAEAEIEAVTASVARIAALQDAEAVKALFKATAAGASAVELTVSNDDVYTVDTALNNYTGTNATVTFYTEVGGIKVPVATVKVVVEADVNGDGVLDVLDGALTELVSNGHAELEGCYKIAANLDTASNDIVATDYSLVVNKIVAA